MKLLALLKLLFIMVAIVESSKTKNRAGNMYYPGRGCGLGTPYRFFLTEPEDKTLLKCAFVGDKYAHLAGGKFPPAKTPITDCSVNWIKGNTMPGVYSITIKNKAVSVYCAEEGWTVFQSRGQFGNPEEYFVRGWTSYLKAFGTPGEEHWLGLENIYELTQALVNEKRQYQLRVKLEATSDKKGVAYYDNFYLTNRDTFTLYIGNYTGTAGDSLTPHNNSGFSTFDRDNDGGSGFCAKGNKGGWWFYTCHDSNLNGRNTPRKGNNEGINWAQFHGWTSLESAEMAVRPMDFEL